MQWPVFHNHNLMETTQIPVNKINIKTLKSNTCCKKTLETIRIHDIQTVEFTIRKLG